MRKRNRLFAILLCCLMVLSLFPAKASAANYPTLDLSIPVTKTVEQGGNVAPGEQSFAFVLSDINGKTPADYGITMTNSTVSTTGVGVFTGALTGSIETSNMDSINSLWSKSDTVDRVYSCEFELSEQSNGYVGWRYSDATYGVRITCNLDEGKVTVDIYDDVSEAEAAFTNIYTDSKYQFTVKKTDEAGNPLAGATFSLTGTGNSVGEYFEAVSGNDGIATFNVPEGFFTLAEKTAPAGYIKTDDTYEISVWGGAVHFYKENLENADNADNAYSDYQQVTFINKAEKTVVQKTDTDKLPKSPQTGDNSRMSLWLTLLCASVAGLIGTAVYGKKKRNVK